MRDKPKLYNFLINGYLVSMVNHYRDPLKVADFMPEYFNYYVFLESTLERLYSGNFEDFNIHGPLAFFPDEDRLYVLDGTAAVHALEIRRRNLHLVWSTKLEMLMGQSAQMFESGKLIIAIDVLGNRVRFDKDGNILAQFNSAQ